MKKLINMSMLALAVTFAFGSHAASVEDAMAKPGRLQSDIDRDARSQPQAVIPLLALEPGDRVADIFGGGGYYSELLATVVGPDGEVLLQNNAAYKQFANKGLTTRFEGRDPGAITLLDSEAEDLELGTGTIDAAMIIMSYHDLYHVDAPNGWRDIDANDFLDQIHRALKPGGRFLIVDHYAAPGSGSSAAQDLHRIDVEFAKTDISSHGFTLVGGSDALRNPDDDYSIMVFKPEVRGKTDRFVLVFEKN
ncbi:MAG: methyltransferase domain-containing protein [Marinobacter sp.]|uniref:class I SAM-dependent methyltransferase n=1 Tax=Marinobacter sp. TaxID=50741 RepID=UPI003299EB7C